MDYDEECEHGYNVVQHIKTRIWKKLISHLYDKGADGKQKIPVFTNQDFIDE